jgi:carnitine-CoA ligase
MPQASIHPVALPRLLERRAVTDGGRPFLLYQDQTVTFSEANRRADTAANGYQALGVGRGDRVLVMLGNRPAWIEAWLGLAKLGALEVPVNTALRGRSLIHQCNDSQAGTLVLDRAFLPSLADVVGELTEIRRLILYEDQLSGPPIPVDPRLGHLEIIPFDALTAGSDHPVTLALEPRDLAAIMYTSGTTGPSKGVLCPWGHVYSNSNSNVEADALDGSGTLLLHLPLFHIGGQWFGMAGCIIAGATLALGREFHASTFWQEARDKGATAALLIGSMANFLLQQPPSPADRDHGIKRIVCTPAPTRFEEFERRFGVKLSVSYGLTEASTPIGSSGPDLPGMCGIARSAEFDLVVADDNDVPVPDGQVGELLVRPILPWTVMAGYWRRPEETELTWRNLWLHTGDLFRCDADGRYTFVDRADDVIRRRGENVSATELEAEALAHPLVAEAAAVAVPAEQGEDEIKLCLRARPGEILDPEEVLAFLAVRVPAFMVPRYLAIMDEFPRTATEKVRKPDLRAAGVSGAWDREKSRRANIG